MCMHIDSETQMAEEKQGFLRAYQMGVLQKGHGTRDLVVENVCVLGEEAISRDFLVLDYFRDYLAVESGDDLGLRETKRDLIRELVKVARSLGTLTEETPDSQVHVSGGIEEFFYLPRHLQGRQMQHNGDPYPGAQICRTGRKVPVARTECIVDFVLYHIVDIIYLADTLGQLTAGRQDLDPQVVLFVDHRREEFPFGDNDTSWPPAESVVSADKMSLYEKMSVQNGGFVYTDIEDSIAKLEQHKDISELVEYSGFLSNGAAAQEFVAGQVSRQANPGRYDDIGHRSGTVKPVIYVIAKIRQLHIFCRAQYEGSSVFL